ncbi:MAG: hypothetical protein B0A82_19365 [Alkalinema sp. CACIAM 70d]|nr:MAG: hypothetical protein B0A82_19365 [Alkalinema sp. CACIAM 70d]
MKKRYLASSRLLASLLIAGSILPGSILAGVSPAVGEVVPAGTAIRNTATAAYEDPNGAQYDAKSNTVQVAVAEVAGVLVTPLATIDRNGGSILPNDGVDFEFKVTNVGNDTTELFIPTDPIVAGPGTAAQVFIAGYLDAQGNRVNFTNPVLVTYPNPANARTSTIPGLPAIGAMPTGVLPAGYSYVVTIPVTIQPQAASGADITVRLGDTGANDNSLGSQNQPDAPDTALPTEVRTLDSSSETGATAAVLPATEEREASAVQSLKVGAQAQALATVLKTMKSYDAKNVAVLTDDELTYELGLRVEGTAPIASPGLTPGNLVGINVLGIGPNRVLISDAVPANTNYIAGSALSSDPQWTPVFTDAPLSTPAPAATWYTAAPPSGQPVTRVGFVYNAATNALSMGYRITGMTFKVRTTGASGSSSNIVNLAQVFGQTEGITGNTAPLVYDESGDAQPSNFNDNGTPGATASLTPSSTTIPNGQANPTNHGVDSANNNSGQGPGGEDNVYTIALPGTVLNGPIGMPGAVGRVDNNDDFTNRSAALPANALPGSTIDPAAVTFQNTVSNPSPTASLTGLLLVPDAANFTPATGEQLPPNQTQVTLTYGGQTAVYAFDTTAGNFILQSGAPIQIPSLAPGQQVNYSVAVDLPAGTPLSTDTGKGFAVPLYAFVDQDGDSRPDPIAVEPMQNRTIDRVYTGFLKLAKTVTLLEANGTVAADQTNAKRGQLLEYAVTYENISIAPVGVGNVTLNANNITLTEDGDNGNNTWAKETNGAIQTSHVLASVTSTYGTTAYWPSGEQTGTTKATDVSRYVHQPGVVIQPQTLGQFTFRRKIN